jgi:Putative Actinobacterial Holin-X, holin superfamily III
MSDSYSDAEDLRRVPTGELVKRLAEETSTLVRQELELARAEVTQKAKKTGFGLGELGAAGIASLYALGALTACAIAALALALPVWLSALIVAAVYAIVALILALVGRNQLRQGLPPVPEQTQETLKEDVEWLKNRTRSDAR